MKHLFLFALMSATILSCTYHGAATSDPDYGLLILQKRIDSLEKRVNALDSSLVQLKGTKMQNAK